MQVDTDLLRLPAVECPAVVRRRRAVGRQPHRDTTAPEALDVHEIALVRGVDVHHAGDECVVAIADLGQMIPPSLERPSEGEPALGKYSGGSRRTAAAITESVSLAWSVRATESHTGFSRSTRSRRSGTSPVNVRRQMLG